MGLYPPGPSSIPVDDQAPGITELPFKVRDHSAELPYDFTAVPVFNFESGNYNEAKDESCPALFQRLLKNFSTDAVYSPTIQFYYESSRRPIGIALNLSDAIMNEANFRDLYFLADVVVSKQFEGHEMEWVFTPETEAMMYNIQPISMLETLTEDDIVLLMSKTFDRTFKMLEHHVQRMLGLTEPIPVLD